MAHSGEAVIRVPTRFAARPGHLSHRRRHRAGPIHGPAVCPIGCAPVPRRPARRSFARNVRRDPPARRRCRLHHVRRPRLCGRRSRRGQSRHVRRHARAGNNHILLEEGRIPVPSQFKTHARSAQLCDCVTDLRLATGFRRCNAGATLRAKKGCSNSRPRQPDDQHALARKFDSGFHGSAAQGSSCALLPFTDTG